MAPGAHLGVIGQFGHELVINGGDHQPDEPGALGHHGTGHIVGGVAHFVAELDDALPGVAADLVAAGEGAGNGGVGDAGRLGDVLQGYTFHGFPSFPPRWKP